MVRTGVQEGAHYSSVDDSAFSVESWEYHQPLPAHPVLCQYSRKHNLIGRSEQDRTGQDRTGQDRRLLWIMLF